MRAVVQRVREAEVIVEKDGSEFTSGKIGNGITLLIGVGKNDTIKDVEWMSDKIVNLRIFPDEEDKTVLVDTVSNCFLPEAIP